MPTKYILWRVSNGWLLTTSTTIWESHDQLSGYAVFSNLHDFVAWDKDQERKRKQGIRIHATRPNNKRNKQPKLERPTIVTQSAA